jgi:hypothetical protein
MFNASVIPTTNETQKKRECPFASIENIPLMQQNMNSYGFAIVLFVKLLFGFSFLISSL